MINNLIKEKLLSDRKSPQASKCDKPNGLSKFTKWLKHEIPRCPRFISIHRERGKPNKFGYIRYKSFKSTSGETSVD